MSELLDDIDQSIRARRLLRLGQRILVAVSGGVDSMVLLHLLHALSPRYGWRLTVAHLNHQLRGRSSDADERLVRRIAQRLKLPLVVERVAVAQLARARKLSVEMAAREARHAFLARHARRKRITTIALAHHADDQLELFFLRLLRGSGGEGLAGMKWRAPSASDSQVELIRPLLDQPKAALAEYAKENRIPFREDASNAVLDFQRNRIRHELLPLLRRKYQPALDKTVLRAMNILGADAEFAAEAAREWLGEGKRPKAEVRGPKEGRRARSQAALDEPRRQENGPLTPSLSPSDGERVPPTARSATRARLSRSPSEGERVPKAGEGAVHSLKSQTASGKLPRGTRQWPRGPFNELPVAVQRRCVQFQLIRLGVKPEYELVERLRLEPDQPVSVGSPGPEREGGKTGEPPVLRCVVRDGRGVIHLRTAGPEEFSSNCVEVDLQAKAGEIIFGGAHLAWRTFAPPLTRLRHPLPIRWGEGWGEGGAPSVSSVMGRRRAPQAEFFDADRVGSPIRLRHWQPGDRFQPIGMPRPVKLQDVFTNLKVPRLRRRRLVVAIAANGEIFWVEGLRIAERFKLTERTIRRLQWRWKRL